MRILAKKTFFVQHPGGGHWLESTRGQDITEAFEAAHPFIGSEKSVCTFLAFLLNHYHFI